MPKVRGRQRATAMVAVRPGIAPKIIPVATPPMISSIGCRARTSLKPLRIMVSIFNLLYQIIPEGSISLNQLTNR